MNRDDLLGLGWRAVLRALANFFNGDGGGSSVEGVVGGNTDVELFDDGSGSGIGDPEPKLSVLVEYLIGALKNLPETCKNFLGTSSAINQRISEIQSGALPLTIVSGDSPEANRPIPNGPGGMTLQQYWENIPAYVRGNSVAYTVNFGGQTQPYNSIILGPSWGTGDPGLLSMVGGDLVRFRELSLVHEFMHVLNNMGDNALFRKWEAEGAVLDGSLHPSQALYKFSLRGVRQRARLEVIVVAIKKSVVYLVLVGLSGLILILIPIQRWLDLPLGASQLENLFVIKQEARVDAGFGPIWTINLVVPREHFAENNLTQIFRLVSSKHPDREEKLHITVYTSLENWERQQEEFPLDFGLPGGQVPYNPQDRRNLCDAMFFREGNGDFASGGDNEWYWYSPDLNDPNETKTVVLKGTVDVGKPNGQRRSNTR